MGFSLRRIRPGSHIQSITIRAASDRGVLRPNNEDRFSVDRSGVAVVADGLGGQAAGEVASEIAVETLAQGLRTVRPLLLGTNLEDYESIAHAIAGIVSIANMRIYQKAASEPDKEGMGTTLDAAIVLGEHLYVAHVGDSRVYRISDGVVDQLTRDHTLAALMLAEGRPAEEAAGFENVLVRSVGSDPELQVDVHRVRIHPGDCILLVTDGVWRYFPNAQEFAEILEEEGEVAPEAMIQEAIDLGGEDNATAVLMMFE